MAWNYSNTSVETTLSSGIGTGDTSITIGSIAGLPVSFPYTLVLDYGAANLEVVSVTSLAGGTTLNVTRGQDGTAAQSHSAGAKVVHGVVARDLREPQTHIEATSNVHGVGGASAVVGTTATQTLTNKTISGANNTLSNIATSSVVGIFNNLIAAAATAADTALEVRAAASQTADIFRVEQSNGDPTVAVDAAGDLFVNFDRKLKFGMLANGSITMQSQIIGDTVPRFASKTDGQWEWGPGNAARDTNLYRSAPNTLKTDDALIVTGQLDASGGIVTPAWQNYTPVITASSGGFAIGNGTMLGRWQDLGKTVNFEMMFTWGSTTAGGTGTWSISLPVNRDATQDTVFSALIIDASASTAGYRPSAGLAFGANGFIVIMFDGTNGRVLAPGVPWVWATGDIIRASGTYMKA